MRSKKNYMTDIRGLGEDQAQQELDLIDSEKVSNQELFGFPTNEKPTIDKTAKKDEKRR